MEKILIAYGVPKETVTDTILHKNTSVMVCSPDGNPDFLDIVAGVLQGEILTPY